MFHAVCVKTCYGNFVGKNFVKPQVLRIRNLSLFSPNGGKHSTLSEFGIFFPVRQLPRNSESPAILKNWPD